MSNNLKPGIYYVNCHNRPEVCIAVHDGKIDGVTFGHRYTTHDESEDEWMGVNSVDRRVVKDEHVIHDLMTAIKDKYSIKYPHWCTTIQEAA